MKKNKKNSGFTCQRILWVVMPLLTIAWFSADEWPSRVMMQENNSKEILLPAAEKWKDSVDYTNKKILRLLDIKTISNDNNSHIEAQPTVLISPTENKLTITKDSEKLNINSTSNIEQVAVSDIKPLSHDDKELAISENTVKTTTHEQKLLNTQTIPSGDPAFILTLGDSLMGEVAAGFRMGLSNKVKIKDFHKSSTGLTNTEYYNWPDTAQKYVSQYKPDWVVLHMGGNDAQDMKINGAWIKFASEEWQRIYLDRAKTLIKNIKKANPETHIVWIGLPGMRSPKFDSRISVIQKLQQQASLEENILFIDGKRALGRIYQKDGEFNGKRRTWRADDGIHYSREGGRLLARETSLDKTTSWDWNDKN